MNGLVHYALGLFLVSLSTGLFLGVRPKCSESEAAAEVVQPKLPKTLISAEVLDLSKDGTKKAPPKRCPGFSKAELFLQVVDQSESSASLKTSCDAAADCNASTNAESEVCCEGTEVLDLEIIGDGTCDVCENDN